MTRNRVGRDVLATDGDGKVRKRRGEHRHLVDDGIWPALLDAIAGDMQPTVGIEQPSHGVSKSRA
jgi:hypothetical protein